MASESKGPRHPVLIVALAVYILCNSLEGAYFGASFYGAQPPSFLNWIGQLNFTELNLIDTFGLIVFAALIAYAFFDGRKRRPRTERAGAGVNAVAFLFALLVLAVVVFLLSTHGITLGGLLAGLERFVGWS